MENASSVTNFSHVVLEAMEMDIVNALAACFI